MKMQTSTKTGAALAQAVKRAGGQLLIDMQILVLAGFLSNQIKQLDPEALADCMADLMSDAKLPPELCVEFLCFLCDRYELEVEFVRYLSEFVETLTKPAQPAAPAPVPDQQYAFMLTSETYARVFDALDWGSKFGLSLKDAKLGLMERLGTMTVSPVTPGGSTMTACVDLFNNSDGPCLDFYMMSNGRCVASAQCLRDLDRPVVITYGGTKYEFRLVHQPPGPQA